MNLSIFAERLSELMFEQQLNAPKLAAQVDCTPATINRYVAAKKMPAVQMVVRLSNFFGCTTDFLLGLEDESYTRIFRKCPTFQQRLPKLCEEFHITKAELQRKTGIPEAAIYNWQRGDFQPSTDNVVKIAQALECSVDFVLGRSNN